MNEAGRCIEKAVRENLAGQLVKLGQEVVELSASVKDRQTNRLDCVVRQQSDKKGSEPGVPAEPWPSLLSELRSQFWQIKGNLEGMNAVLERLEI